MKYQIIIPYIILCLLCHLSIHAQQDSIQNPTWKLNFIISEIDGAYIPDVELTILPKEKSDLFSFSYSHEMGYIMEYDASIVLTEDMILQVNHDLYEPLEVELLRLRYSKRIYLGKKGMQYCRQGNLDIPFIALPHKAGGLLTWTKNKDEFAKALLKKGLNFQEITPGTSNDMAVIYRMDGLNLDQEDYLWMRESGIFLAVGPVINMYTDVFGFMNHHINIQFKNTIDGQKTEEIYQKFGLKKIKEAYQFSYQHARVEASKSIGLEILSLADSIRNHPYVELADVQFYQHIGHRNINRVNPYAPPVLTNLEPDNMIIAVMLSGIVDKKQEEDYYQLLEELEPAPPPFPKDFNDEMFSTPSEEIYYFKKKDNTPFARFNCSILERLRSCKFILAAGCTTTGEDIVQNELLLHFVHQDKEKALALLEKHQIEITGGNSDYMVAKTALDIGIGIFDLKAILEKSGLFTMIEMNAYIRVWMD